MKEALLYQAALEYQIKIEKVENYKSIMIKPENRYEGWWADLASDVIYVKRIAREKYRAQVEMIKGESNAIL